MKKKKTLSGKMHNKLKKTKNSELELIWFKTSVNTAQYDLYV